MKPNIFRKDWLKDYEAFKSKVISRYGEEGLRNLKRILPRLATFHYKRKRTFLLLGAEREMYNFLIENSYHPFTIYHWSLLERLPEDIRFQLKNGTISQKTAFRLKAERRNETKSQVCQDIKAMGLRLVRSM